MCACACRLIWSFQSRKRGRQQSSPSTGVAEGRAAHVRASEGRKRQYAAAPHSLPATRSRRSLRGRHRKRRSHRSNVVPRPSAPCRRAMVEQEVEDVAFLTAINHYSKRHRMSGQCARSAVCAATPSGRILTIFPPFFDHVAIFESGPRQKKKNRFGTPAVSVRRSYGNNFYFCGRRVPLRFRCAPCNHLSGTVPRSVKTYIQYLHFLEFYQKYLIFVLFLHVVCFKNILVSY